MELRPVLNNVLEYRYKKDVNKRREERRNRRRIIKNKWVYK